MPIPHRARVRLERNLRKHLAQGWQRAVFATPAGRAATSEQRIVEGPGPGRRPAPAELDSLIADALVAAEDGLIRQTYVLDPRTSFRVDARHGGIKWRRLDQALVAKITGGKQRTLRPDTSEALLRSIGIMNADGTISAKNAKKYKQIDHMVELARPLVDEILQSRTVSEADPLRIVDLACGNSYLTFVLAEALRLRAVPVRIHGIDQRADVIERSRARAKALGFEHLGFSQSTVEEAAPAIETTVGGPLDLVLSLHGCDTASDEALALAIARGAAGLMIVPCCQRQLAQQLLTRGDLTPLGPLGKHSLFLQEYAALLTDALRVEVLERYGYRVDVMEFVAPTHTPKNILVRGRKTVPARTSAEIDLQPVIERCHRLAVRPALLDLLAAGS